ncbi:MAG: hypothetical protein U0610_09725 [bacterium]
MSLVERASGVRWLGCAWMAMLVACPDGAPPDFEGILALTSSQDESATPRLRLEWKKGYDASAFRFDVFAAVDRDPDASTGSPDRLASLPSTTLALDVDPRTLFAGAPPADYRSRDYRFVVAAFEEEDGLARTSEVASILPATQDACGCSSSPTVTVPGVGAVPFLAACAWTEVEGAQACHWTARTDVPNDDPAEPDEYGVLRAEIYFHPQASARRPVVLALHGGTAYSALGLEYASVALASHAVIGEGGDHARGNLVIAPQMRDAFAGTPGTTAEGEEIARVESVIAIVGFFEDLVTPGTARYQAALASLLAARFDRIAVSGGSDGGITSAAVAATPPGPLPFPHGDLVFPTVPFRSRIRAAFIVAPGATASPHAMNLKDGPTSIGGQMTMPVAVLSDDMDLTDSNDTAAKVYAYMTADDPDPSSPEKDRYLYHVHNGQDDTIPSRNVHVCLADPRGFPDANLCDDRFSVDVLGLPIEPSMLDHHRLLRHHVRAFLDRYLWGDESISHASLVAPWFSPSHPTPDPGQPASGFDADGYPVPVVVEETGPAR